MACASSCVVRLPFRCSCQVTAGLGVGYVAGSLGLRPATMDLTAGAVAQAELALRNCAAVLDGLRMCASNALALVMYVTELADAAAVHATAMRWLRRTTERRDGDGDAVADLPPVLMLQVGALPMGALVEAQLEACAAAAPALLRARWSMPIEVPRGELKCEVGELKCEVAMGGMAAADGAEAEHAISCVAASGTATFRVVVEDGADLAIDRLASTVAAAVDTLEARLRECVPALTLSSTLYARAFYDEGLGLGAAQLARAIGAALSHPRTCRQCSAFALPVVRVLEAGAVSRLAVQLHVTAAHLADDLAGAAEGMIISAPR